MNTQTKAYQPVITFTTAILPEYEVAIFGLILQHMFDRYTKKISQAKRPAVLSGEVAVELSNLTFERRETLVLMECFEGSRLYPDTGTTSPIKITINGRALSDEMIDMIRHGCENFERDSQSDYHRQVACKLKNLIAKPQAL